MEIRWELRCTKIWSAVLPANTEFIIEHQLVAEAYADIDAHFWSADADMLNSFTFDLSSADSAVSIIEVAPTAISNLSVVRQGSNREIRLIDVGSRPPYNLEYTDGFGIWNLLDVMTEDGADQVLLDTDPPPSGTRFYRALRFSE